MPERESHPPENNPLGKKAAAHPEYEKYMQAAGAAESVNPEDAMEHAEDTADNPVYLASRAYHLRRAFGSDASGWSAKGDHKKKPQELAATYKITVPEAEELFTQAEIDLNHDISEWAGRMDRSNMIHKAERELDQLLRRLDTAA